MARDAKEEKQLDEHISVLEKAQAAAAVLAGFVQPVTTHCGHTFEEGSLKGKVPCPDCDQEIDADLLRKDLVLEQLGPVFPPLVEACLREAEDLRLQHTRLERTHQMQSQQNKAITTKLPLLEEQEAALKQRVLVAEQRIAEHHNQKKEIEEITEKLAQSEKGKPLLEQRHDELNQDCTALEDRKKAAEQTLRLHQDNEHLKIEIQKKSDTLDRKKKYQELEKDFARTQREHQSAATKLEKHEAELVKEEASLAALKNQHMQLLAATQAELDQVDESSQAQEDALDKELAALETELAQLEEQAHMPLDLPPVENKQEGAPVLLSAPNMPPSASAQNNAAEEKQKSIKQKKKKKKKNKKKPARQDEAVASDAASSEVKNESPQDRSNANNSLYPATEETILDAVERQDWLYIKSLLEQAKTDPDTTYLNDLNAFLCEEADTYIARKDEAGYAKGLKLFELTAEQGDAADAQVALGLLHFTGEGVAENAHNAVPFFQRAAEQGSKKGQYYLGYCYQYGYGIAQDIEEAARLFQLAADQGFAEAICMLAICYYDGDGVEKSLSDAKRLITSAIQQGYAKSTIAFFKLVVTEDSECEELLKFAQDEVAKLSKPRAPDSAVGFDYSAAGRGGSRVDENKEQQAPAPVMHQGANNPPDP